MNGILSNGLKIVGPQCAEVFASRYISKLCAPALSFKVLKAFKIKESSQRCLNCSNHFEGKGSNRIETGASVEMAFNCNLLRLAGIAAAWVFLTWTRCALAPRCLFKSADRLARLNPLENSLQNLQRILQMASPEEQYAMTPPLTIESISLNAPNSNTLWNCLATITLSEPLDAELTLQCNELLVPNLLGAGLIHLRGAHFQVCSPSFFPKNLTMVARADGNMIELMKAKPRG